MRCRACGHVISVRRAADGGVVPEDDEPLEGSSPPAAPRPVDVPPPARDENPFETQPISIAAVRAALDALERKKAQEAGLASSTGLPEPLPEGSMDLVLDREIPGPGSQPVSTSPPLPERPPGGASAGTPSDGDPIEDPFADWDADDRAAPQPPPPEPAPVAEGRSVPRTPARIRPPPADAPVRRRSSRLFPVLAAVGAVAVAAILLWVLGPWSRPAAEAESPAPDRLEAAPAQVDRARPRLAESPPAQPAPLASEPSLPSPSHAGGSAAEGESVKEKRRLADERRSKERRGRAARAEPRPGPPPKKAAAAPPPASPAPAERRGPPSREQVVNVVRANWKAFQSCIGEATRRNPGLDLAGRTVNLRMTVQPSGSVNYPTLDDAGLTRTDLGACLKSAARQMVFPRFQGDPFSVEVPLQLGK
jgi:hypothetical protein